jgi:hypothetical protein
MMENHDEGASFSTANPVEVPEPTDQASIADKPASTLDDLTSLLSEFESATKSPEAPEPKTDAGTNQTTPPVDPVAAALIDGLNYDQVRGALKTQGDVVNRPFQHQIQQQNKNDFDIAVNVGNQKLKDAGYHVGDDYVERWLAAEANLNPRLRHAFDMRYESPAWTQHYEKLVDKAMYKLLASAKSQIDQNVTEDKYAVVAALKGASSSTAPPEGPVRYGDLTDREFEAEKKKLGIG